MDVTRRQALPRNLDEAIFRTVALAEEIRKCTRCFLYRGCRQPLIGSGYPLAGLMLIKSYPTKVEDENGVAFCGMLSSVLKQGFQKLGLDVTDIYATNALKCAARERLVGEYQKKACLSFLQKEIDIVQPQHIVAMGNLAVAMLEKLAPLKQGQGWRVGQPVRWNRDTQVLMTENISEALRNSHLRREFWDALGCLPNLQKTSTIQ